MPRRVRRRRRLHTGGYREHRLAIWGVTGCVAVAAGVALTAGLAAASPQLGDIPGSTDHRPALAGLPTLHPTTGLPTGAQRDAGTNQRPTVVATYSPAPATTPASASPRASIRPHPHATYFTHP